MEDVKFTRTHSNSPLPEAGNDPGDPLRPEIDLENSTPNPPITAPDQDMEVVEPDEKSRLPDQDDLEEAGLSDNESELSELDDARFNDLDIGDIAVEERPAQIIDDTNLNLIGVHKRKRAEGEGEGEAKKKKKKRADKPRRKKKRDDDEVVGDGEDLGTRRSKRSRKPGRAREASPENEEDLTPEERRKRALDQALKDAKGGGYRRGKKKEGDETNVDAEVEEMRRRMAAAAEADNNGRQNGEPARHKLKLLPEVVALLNRTSIANNIVDPDTNLIEAVRFFLEPLSDGSLPAYNIQKELFAALAKLPITKECLVSSGIGKVILFYIKSKRPEMTIKRQAERLFTEWTRPILRRTDDFRKKEIDIADFDHEKTRARVARPANPRDIARAKMLETPKVFQRARMEAGPLTYSVAPKTNFNPIRETGKSSSGGDDILRRLKARQGGRR